MDIFNVFYSWQSDLPSNKTREFIKECIDEAIELALDSETIEAERDEATKGTTGSPNIVQSIFSKINECDLFIADITPCYSDNAGRGKKSPNPNVLIELGYAIKTLGEERVLCICNTDYGTDYPFDIAHNRITQYSLDGEKKRREKKAEVSRIIFLNIRDLRNQSSRSKSGVANHIVGSYDLEEKKVKSILVALDIRRQEEYVKNNNRILEKAKSLLNDINNLSKTIGPGLFNEENCSSEIIDTDSGADATDSPRTINEEILKLFSEGTLGLGERVSFGNQDEIRKQIKILLDIEIGDMFFDLGNLRRKKSMLPHRDYDYYGSMEEIEKYDKLTELSYLLTFYDLRQQYPNTFKDMLFIPIAIQNVSDISDNDIRIVAHIYGAELVRADKRLIADEIGDLQGLLCENDQGLSTIRDLFKLPEDGMIHREIVESSKKTLPYVPRFDAFGQFVFEKDEEDYEQELDEYITFPSGDNYYEFEINQLRPNECKWLDTGILIKPIEQKVSLNYQIHSAHSTGTIRGSLTIERY